MLYLNVLDKTLVYYLIVVRLLTVSLDVLHLSAVRQDSHHDERVAEGNDRHGQKESKCQQIHVVGSVGNTACSVVPGAGRVEALRHVAGPAEERREGHGEAVEPGCHTHLTREISSLLKSMFSSVKHFARPDRVATDFGF